MDWSKAPAGAASGTVKIAGASQRGRRESERVQSRRSRRAIRCKVLWKAKVLFPSSRNISQENTDAGANRWIKIQDYGRTLVGHEGDAAGGRAERDAGKRFAVSGISNVSVQHRRGRSRDDHLADIEFYARAADCALAVSFDDETPQVITLVPADYKAQNGNRDWEKIVGDNARTRPFQRTCWRNPVITR